MNTLFIAKATQVGKAIAVCDWYVLFVQSRQVLGRVSPWVGLFGLVSSSLWLSESQPPNDISRKKKKQNLLLGVAEGRHVFTSTDSLADSENKHGPESVVNAKVWRLRLHSTACMSSDARGDTGTHIHAQDDSHSSGFSIPSYSPCFCIRLKSFPLCVI